MIHDEIVTHEVSKLAKEKGFDLDCPMFYNPEGKLKYGWAYDPMNSGLDMRDMLCHNSKLPLGFGAECTAPTRSLLQRWLREEKGVNMQVIWMEPYDRYYWSLWINDEFRVSEYIDPEQAYSNYELALEDALKYALENLV